MDTCARVRASGGDVERGGANPVSEGGRGRTLMSFPCARLGAEDKLHAVVLGQNGGASGNGSFELLLAAELHASHVPQLSWSRMGFRALQRDVLLRSKGVCVCVCVLVT